MRPHPQPAGRRVVALAALLVGASAVAHAQGSSYRFKELRVGGEVRDTAQHDWASEDGNRYNRIKYTETSIVAIVGRKAHERRNPRTGQMEHLPAYRVRFEIKFSSPPKGTIRAGDDAPLELRASWSVFGDIPDSAWSLKMSAGYSGGLRGPYKPTSLIKVGRFREDGAWKDYPGGTLTSRTNFHGNMAPGKTVALHVSLDYAAAPTAWASGVVVEWIHDVVPDTEERTEAIERFDPVSTGPATDVEVLVVMGAPEGDLTGAQVDFGSGISLLGKPSVTRNMSGNFESGHNLKCKIRVDTDAALGPRKVGVTAPGGTVYRGEFYVRPYVAIIDIDGMIPEVLRKALAVPKGEASMVGLLLGRSQGKKTTQGLAYEEFEHGIWVEDAVTVFPSYTFPSQASIFTSVSPGVHGVVGNEFLDRSGDVRGDGVPRHYAFTGTYTLGRGLPDVVGAYTKQLANKALTPEAPTIYSFLRDKPFLGRSGVAHNPFSVGVDRADWLDPPHYELLLYPSSLTVHMYDGFMSMKACDWLTDPRQAEALHLRPSVQTLYYSSLDHIAHKEPGSEEDKQLGSLADVVNPTLALFIRAARAQFPGVVFVITADHGHTDVSSKTALKLEDFQPVLHGQIGRRTRREISLYPEGVGLRSSNVLVAMNGGMAHIYTKSRVDGTKGWKFAPSLEFTHDVADLLYDASRGGWPGLDTLGVLPLVLVRDVGAQRWDAPYRVYCGNGKTNDLESYLAASYRGVCKLFGWDDSPRDSKFLTQLIQSVSCKRSGDIVIICHPDYYICYQDQMGEHGSLLKSDMNMPFIVAQPQAENADQILDVLLKAIRDPSRPRVLDVGPTVAAFCGQTWKPKLHWAEGGPGRPGGGGGGGPLRLGLRSAEGDAQVQHPDGGWGRASAGMQLADGTSLKTGPDGSASVVIEPEDGPGMVCQQIISSGSQVVLDTGSTDITVGEVALSITPDAEPAVFAVETPLASVTVAGTTFTVSHQDAPERATLIAVGEGQVDVVPKIAGYNPRTLGAGDEMRIADGGGGDVDPGGGDLPDGLDLTGIWEDERGVRYWIRQSDGELFWYMDKRPEVLNVFHGVIDGDSIEGEWGDLPVGEVQRGGRLQLRIESEDRFVKVGSNPDIYTGSVWTKVKLRGLTGDDMPPVMVESVDFTGSWAAYDGDAGHGMELQQDGNRVTGTYDVRGGTLEGRVEGRKLTFTWRQGDDDHSGRGEIVLSGDGKSFDGRWWREKPDALEGPWTGTRK